MLIKLLAPTHPTVLFSITYQNLPDELYIPMAWTTLLSNLNIENLEIPSLTHALDKASWIPSILDEITFNTMQMTIHCSFTDGSTEEWPLSSNACLQALEKVLEDVTLSSAEADREREREKEEERQKQELAMRQQQSLNLPTPMVKVKTHKKNRSLLMSFVSSFVGLQTPSFVSAPITRAPSPVPPPSPTETIAIPPPTGLSPKALRRRARSALVDTFRIHVLSELRNRLPNGYYPWIVKSMLRRASEAMMDIIYQAEEMNPRYMMSPFNDDGSYFPPPELHPKSFESVPELDDGDTDTDGSSVHTPSTPHFNIASFPHPMKRKTSLPAHLRDLSSDDLYEYDTLSALCVRLRQLLIIADGQKERIDSEAKQRDDILEIRSKRRAWQNKTLVAGANGNMGLATPYRSSRLSQAVWTAEEYEYVPPVVDVMEEALEEHGQYDEKMVFGSRRLKGGKSEAKLFPVSEEDENADLFDTTEYDLELSLEERLRAWKIDDDDDGEEDAPPIPTLRPRARTKSMHETRRPASLLCQAPIYTEVEVDVPFGDCKRLVGDEFTLAMDVPFQKGLSVSSMDPEPEKHWHVHSSVF